MANERIDLDVKGIMGRYGCGFGTVRKHVREIRSVNGGGKSDKGKVLMTGVLFGEGRDGDPSIRKGEEKVEGVCAGIDGAGVGQRASGRGIKRTF
ncbi:MAG: hypothetical protein ACI3YK_03090 [Eubacteriales bacterium]